MCRLFGLIANKDVDVEFSFLRADKPFRELSKNNPHGWGIGYYKNHKVTIHKEPINAFNSETFFPKAKEVKSRIIISHVRFSTQGNRTLGNTHPFSYEKWIFAHNGTARIRHNPQFRLNFYHPVGETDSEYAFCYILDRIRELGAEKQNDLTALHRVIEQAANEIGQHGKFNFLLSNGEYLFAYANRASLYYLFNIFIFVFLHPF